jgi:hypothetical protein
MPSNKDRMPYSRRSLILRLVVGAAVFWGVMTVLRTSRLIPPPSKGTQSNTCPSGSTCAVTLGDQSYMVQGPCDVTSVSSISTCHILFTLPKGTINDARVAMLPFMVFLWAIAWWLRYMPPRITNPWIKVPAILLLAVGTGGPAIGALIVFRARAGVRGELFKGDPFSLALFLAGELLGLCILFSSVAARDKKQQVIKPA